MKSRILISCPMMNFRLISALPRANPLLLSAKLKGVDERCGCLEMEKDVGRVELESICVFMDWHVPYTPTIIA
eukprot:1819187-Ditylum_brightwellii.AAC.1